MSRGKRATLNGRKRRRIKLKLFKENPNCPRCGVLMTQTNGPALWTVDHVIPVSKGGTDDQRNLVLMCVTCNEKKADLIQY